MRMFLLLFLFLPVLAFGQTKPGVEAQNWSVVMGRALTVNCSNTQVSGLCLSCTLTGTTMNIIISNSCASSQYYVTYLGQTVTYLGTKVTYLGR